MTIRTTFRQHTGGAMKKKDRPEAISDRASSITCPNSLNHRPVFQPVCGNCAV
jgi:hypothetical protein